MLSNVSHLIYITLSPVLSTLFIALNAITIFIFWKKFKLTTVCVILIVNICMCDICVCLLSNTFYMFNLMHPTYAWSTGSVSCKLFKFLTMTLNVAQIYFLCFLTADRLRRLIYATMNQWRKRQGLWFIAIGWGLATILTAPRLALYDQGIVTRFFPAKNKTEIVNYKCKPVGLDDDGYIAATIFLFVLAYAIPATFILYAAIRTQIFMWKRRNSIHISTTNNFVTKMKSKLSLTFNLTAASFMLIWTPFFVMSIIDLTMDLLGRRDLTHVNFTFRCSLLIAGSAKPVIYLICLDKFRSNFRIAASSQTKPIVFETSSEPNQSQVGAINTRETQATGKNTATNSEPKSQNESCV